MKILLTGKTGQVGHELARSLQGLGEVLAPERGEMDLANLEQVRAFILAARPDLIVNPAAYTAVDKAESEPELARRINAEAPAVMARAARELGAAMVHYSTDYVFDGTKDGMYTEGDEPNPQSVYGRSKLEGDRAVASLCPAHWIFRTSWVYGVHGGNFLKTILRLAAERESMRVVADQRGAPTWARTIANVSAAALCGAAKMGRTLPQHVLATAGVYNLCAGGETTWHGYACHAVAQAAACGAALKLTPAAITPIPTEDYPLPAPRPRNSRLSTKKIQDTFQIGLPEWQADIDLCIAQLQTRA